MNTDDFEKQLQRQPLRQVPRDWREDILRTAQAGASTPERGVLVRAGLKLWRELIWPCRHAWSGLAALWIVIAVIHAGMSGSSHGVAPMQGASVPARFEAIEEQRRVLAELIPPAGNPPVERSRLPAPRTDRGIELFQA